MYCRQQISFAAGLLLMTFRLCGAPTGSADTHAKQWAFQPPRASAAPKVGNSSWPRSPLDYFILAKLEEQGLQPAPPANKPTLLRRVTFDLTGLPPSPEEIDAFLSDTSANAFEKVVELQPGSATGPFHWNNRRLSREELCRLQTFPDGYRIAGNLRSAHKQLGNAVPSALASRPSRMRVTRTLSEPPLFP